MVNVSVLMSVYNEPLEWIKKSIDSILTQTYSDFEFIIINDKPDRNELKVFLNEQAKKDSRIVIHTNTENIGLARSLNVGIKICRGKYIARMDCDDISHPQRFEKQIDYLESHPLVGIIGAFGVQIDERGNTIGKINIYEHDDNLKALTLFYSPFIHPSVIIRKELLIENNFDENCRIGQDRELWCRIKDKTEFYNFPEILIEYRISSQQAPQKAGKKRSEESIRYLCGKIAEYWDIDEFYRNTYFKVSEEKPIEEEELNNFFVYLLEKYSDSCLRYFILKKYMRCITQRSKWRLFLNPIFKKYPATYIKTVAHSFIRYIKKHF